ncbi:hypothetical protein DASB73_035500 [Starmerella bacillaris]|uniref:Altered inheritance of mitochondria protein 11 n=1 Tax=Starmerella bacillaris TaxID=1247836 RepID=A0AAV5RN78_STABA|nr:hypothetical protein DASB73_035500 [Starmerella bacillaris]
MWFKNLFKKETVQTVDAPKSLDSDLLLQETILSHNNRNFSKGVIATLVAGALTISAASVCKRSIASRKFVPQLFNSNILPPPFNPIREASRAVNYATLLAGSFFAFTMSTMFLSNGVGTFSELGHVLTKKYSRTDYSSLPQDQESQEVEDKLTSLLNRKSDTSKK